jgi:hypothetical protein
LSSVRGYAGLRVTALLIVDMKYSPARMSAWGWSSFPSLPDDGPASSNVKRGQPAGLALFEELRIRM